MKHDAHETTHQAIPLQDTDKVLCKKRIINSQSTRKNARKSMRAKLKIIPGASSIQDNSGLQAS